MKHLTPAVLLWLIPAAVQGSDSVALEDLLAEATTIVVCTVLPAQGEAGRALRLRVEHKSRGPRRVRAGRVLELGEHQLLNPHLVEGQRLVALLDEESMVLATAVAPEGDLQGVALELTIPSEWSRLDVLPPWITVDMLDAWTDDPLPFYTLVSGGTFLHVHLNAQDDRRGFYSPHPLPDLELFLTNAEGHVELTEGQVTAARSASLVVDLEPLVQTAPTRGPLDCQVTFWGEGTTRVSRCHRDTIGVYRSAGPGLDLFAAAPRGQPSTGRVQRWGDVLVADVEGQPRFVDLEGMQAHSVLMSSCTRIAAVSTVGEQRALLCDREDGRILLVEEAGRWQHEPIPEELRLRAEVLAVASQGQDLAIWTRGHEDPRWTSRVFWRHEGSWKTVTLDDVDALPNRMGTPAHVLLDDGHLWLGFNRGEFGGGLFRLRLDDSSWREMGPDTRHLPVTGLLRADNGDIWVTQGMAHMDLREGRLLRFDGQRWEEVVTSSPLDERWGLPEADFQGLSLDADGHPMLTSGELGILTWSGGEWVRSTPSWARYLPVADLEPAGDSRILVGASDSGLLLCDIDKGSIRAVKLP